MRYDPNLTVTLDNRHRVIGALAAAGHEAPELHAMTNVGLANFYHAAQPDGPGELDASNIDVIVEKVTAAVLASLPPPPMPQRLDEDLVRHLAREEADKLDKALHVPRMLIVHGPQGSVVFDGLVHYMTEKVTRVVSLGHPVMMVGPAGCGKTTIAEHAARALNLPFYITSTINDTYELMGFVDGYGKYHATPFRHAFEYGGVWVADEIDAWSASALLAANSALANGYAAFPDRQEPVTRHTAFRFIATANTFGTGADRVYVGRNELDAASLDRFAVIEIDYDLTLEQAFANGQQTWLDYVWRVRRAVTEKHIRHVVSSRAIGNGAAALASGLSWEDVKEYYLLKGMSMKDREKIPNE